MKAAQTYIKRVITHPSFKNISFKEVLGLMENMDQGECIIRPSSKVRSLVCCIQMREFRATAHSITSVSILVIQVGLASLKGWENRVLITILESISGNSSPKTRKLSILRIKLVTIVYHAIKETFMEYDDCGFGARGLLHKSRISLVLLKNGIF